jgi:hypothetical protein
MATSTTTVQSPFALQTRSRSATHSFATEASGARVLPAPAVGALSRSPLFRSNSLDRYREKRRLRRQWERRRNTNDSNGEGLSGTETGPEDSLNMIETDEPSEMFSSVCLGYKATNEQSVT